MRIFFIMVFLLLNLHAKGIEAKYHVSYGIFGEVGDAKTSLSIKDNFYTVSVEANTTGFARSLSSGRDEFFQSKGVVKDDVLLPKSYLHVVKRMKTKSGFDFDMSKWKKALQKKVKLFKFFDDYIVQDRKKFFDGEEVSHSNKKLDFYVKNDLLSIFFNFKKLSNDYNITKPVQFYAVGGQGKDGRLDVRPMSKNEQKEIFEDESGYNFAISINQPIFSSENGELFVKLDENGIAKEAILKDVLFFGDIRAKLVSSRVLD